MIKMSHLTAALLFVSASVAYAETSVQQSQPAPQGATSVQNNLDANKSGGHADKGLTNALSHIQATHGKGEKSEGTAEVSEGKGEKAEHLAKLDRPVKPDHPVKPERPTKPERVGR